MRCVAASVHCCGLYSWRYGSDTDGMVEEALAREEWSSERWQAWREEKLEQTLELAARNVPYYREHWSKRRRQGERGAHKYLQNWPILQKSEVRKNPAAFIADNFQRRHLLPEYTSGSTGTPLVIYKSRASLRAWYALAEARWRRWYGVSRQDRWAILGGQLIVPVKRKKPPFWIWNPVFNQLYMSSYHLSDSSFRFYVAALIKYKISYIYGYTSSLYALAMDCLSKKVKMPSLAVVITCAEPLLDYQRDVIAEAFHCPVRETYGLTEMVIAASECERGQLHLWPEAGIYEICEDGNGTTPGGEIICTGLLNAAMPLIRYQVGDRGALDDQVRSSCSCGRALPILKNIDGRNDDVLYTADGRRIGRLDLIFKGHLPLREAQIVQETLGQIKVLYVPTADFSQKTIDILRENIHAHVGDIQIVFERVEKIPRNKAGKFRFVMSKIQPPDAATTLR